MLILGWTSEPTSSQPRIWDTHEPLSTSDRCGGEAKVDSGLRYLAATSPHYRGSLQRAAQTWSWRWVGYTRRDTPSPVLEKHSSTDHV